MIFQERGGSGKWYKQFLGIHAMLEKVAAY